jgi:alpha-beta hydrolase superfamily lysophospholipase
MKVKLSTIFILFLVQNLFAQNILGTWYGILDIPGQKLPLVIHIEKENNLYKSTFDSPMQGAKGIPIQTTTFVNSDLHLDASNMGINYKGSLKDEMIEGIFSQNGMDLPLVLSRKNSAAAMNRPQEPKPPFNYDTKDITFKNESEGNLLAGTLASPKNFNKKNPILIMITGSGAQDRNEELFDHQPFLVIADDFAKKGIATLRLDDRGIGESEKGKEGATTADFATDISSAVNYLAKEGFQNIGLIGHSEGGMIAPMVSDANKKARFLVLLAGPGIPIEDLLVQQTNDISKISGEDDKSLTVKEQLNRKMFSYIINYHGGNLKDDLKKMVITELQKLPADQIGSDQIDAVAEQQTNRISGDWFRYFLKFNPDVYLSKVKIPVLAINGSLDLQVAARENLAGIKKSLEKAGNKNFEIVEFKGLNHLMQTAKTGNPAEYAEIEETISPKVLDKVSSWVLALK